MEKNKTYSSAYNGDDSISLFLTFCIEQYAHLKGILGAKSMKILSDAGILEYVSKHYETLHTESIQWILNDIDKLVDSKVLVK